MPLRRRVRSPCEVAPRVVVHVGPPGGGGSAVGGGDAQWLYGVHPRLEVPCSEV